jgi:quercetin dioxygenase-like cupin family protein
MKKLMILAAAVFLVLTLALAQTQDKKPQNSGQSEQQSPTPVSSQAAIIVAPQAYKPGFENARVRVTRVHYEPHETIKSHEHPKLPTIYVYLTDSGPVRFIHTGDEKFILIRPPVKAGGFRLSCCKTEMHEVESLSDQASDFLRIELKDSVVDKGGFRARFPPETKQTVDNSEKVEFENQEIRIIRLTCASGKVCKLNAQSSPYLLVPFTQTMWIESGGRFQLENLGSSPVRFLKVEFKATSW